MEENVNTKTYSTSRRIKHRWGKKPTVVYVKPSTYVGIFFSNEFSDWTIAKPPNGAITCLLHLLQLTGLTTVNYVYLNPFPNKPWFLRVCSTSLLKTLWEKEKLLVTSNFSFSHSVFYPFE